MKWVKLRQKEMDNIEREKKLLADEYKSVRATRDSERKEWTTKE